MKHPCAAALLAWTLWYQYLGVRFLEGKPDLGWTGLKTEVARHYDKHVNTCNEEELCHVCGGYGMYAGSGSRGILRAGGRRRAGTFGWPPTRATSGI